MPFRGYLVLVFILTCNVSRLLSQFEKAQYMDPQIWKENMHRFSAFKDRSKMFKVMSTLLYGPCEVLGTQIQKLPRSSA